MILSNPIMVDPRVHKEAKALIEKGHKVTVIVWDKRREFKEKVVDKIRIERVFNKGLMKILPNDIIKNPLWWRKAYKKAMDLYNKDFHFDAVHCHDLDTLYIGVKLKKKLGIKLVYDAHEIYGIMIKDKHKILSKFAVYLEGKLLPHVDQIITIDEPFEKYYKKKFKKKITIVMNCKDLVYEKYEKTSNDIFTIIYIGIMAKKRFFPEIIEIVGNLEGVKLILAGKKELLYEEMKELSKKYKNVEFLGTVPTKDILPLTRKSDVTFVLIDTKGQTRMNVFNKQFEAMVCGRPILITKGTYAAEMTEKLKCGLSIEFKKESVEKAIISLRDNPKKAIELGKNAFDAAKTKYNWEKEKTKLIEVYEDLK